jgi:hypothetical protein
MLGDGANVDRAEPVLVLGLGRARAVVAHDDSTCALRADGTVACWGVFVGEPCPASGCQGWLSPQGVPGLKRIEEIALGRANPATPATPGPLVHYGATLYARDAAGKVEWRGVHHDLPKTPPFAASVRRLDIGSGGCFLFEHGEPECFGDLGAFGSSRLHPVPAPAGAEQVVVGFAHTCVLQPDRRVACFGSNTAGALGDGTLADRKTFTPVLGLDDVASISARRRATCALRRDGAVWCWGDLGW